MATFIYEGHKVNVTFKENKFGVWQYDASCNGKRFRKSTKQRDRKLAEDFFQKELEKVIKKASGEEEVQTLIIDIWDIFLKTPRAIPLSPQKAKHYLSRLKDFTAYAESLGVVLVQDVTKQIAKQYIQLIRKSGRFSKTKNSYKNLSCGTKNLYLFTLKMLFNTAVDNSLIEQNPFDGIPTLRGRKIPRDIFTMDELDMLINSKLAKKSYLYPLIMLCSHTGMRKGDACCLRSDSISFQNKELTYEPRKTKNYGVTVTVPALPAIEKYLREQDFSNEYLFPELRKLYFSNGSKIGKDFTELLKEHGIKSNKKIDGRDKVASVKDIHSFRHTFVYLCAINGVPMAVVQRAVGHLTPEMTRLYADHATREDMHKHLGKIAFTFSGQRQGLTEEERIMAKLENAPALKEKLLKLLSA